MHSPPRAKRPNRQRFFRSHPAELLLLISFSAAGCLHTSQVADGHHIVLQSKIRPIDVDALAAEKVGQEALEEVGYEKLIKLAGKAGFVEYRSDERIQLASSGSIVASSFVRVFSRYAVAAAVTAQADSPLPGPADLAALGVMVIGLADAGLLDGYLIKSVGKLLTAAGEATLPAPVTTDLPADRSDCRAHLVKCMNTSPSRTRRGSGSHPGQSICSACFDLCAGQGYWPDKSGDDKDCRWWDGT